MSRPRTDPRPHLKRCDVDGCDRLATYEAAVEAFRPAYCEVHRPTRGVTFRMFTEPQEKP